MKKTKFALMTLIGGILLGTNVFAEREVEYDYEKNLNIRNEREIKEIENYSKLKNISIGEAKKEYLAKLQDEFQKNNDIRNQMIKENSKN